MSSRIETDAASGHPGLGARGAGPARPGRPRCAGDASSAPAGDALAAAAAHHRGADPPNDRLRASGCCSWRSACGSRGSRSNRRGGWKRRGMQRRSWLPEQPAAAACRRERPDSRELLAAVQASAGSRATPKPLRRRHAGSPAKRETEDGAVEVAAAPAGARSRSSSFGRLRIGADGTGVSERATRGLIAYLVIKRAPATMDELVEALWPGESPVEDAAATVEGKAAGAAAARRRARSTSKTATRSTAARLRTDIDELEQLRAPASPGMEELERAVTLTREEPLADVDYPWADGERRRLQAIQAELLEQLAKCPARAGRRKRRARRGRTADPSLIALNERGWCLAMEAEGALGNRQAILDRYEQLGRRTRRATRPAARAVRRRRPTAGCSAKHERRPLRAAAVGAAIFARSLPSNGSSAPRASRGLRSAEPRSAQRQRSIWPNGASRTGSRFRPLLALLALWAATGAASGRIAAGLAVAARAVGDRTASRRRRSGWGTRSSRSWSPSGCRTRR